MTTTIALLLTTLPLLILSCHPGKPTSWRTRGVRTRVLTPRLPYTAEEEEDSFSGVDAAKHTTPTSVRLWETTSSPADLPDVARSPHLSFFWLTAVMVSTQDL